MAITLDYKTVKRPPPLPEARGPYIKATLVGPKERLQIVALVDSGADVSAIPGWIAEVLGLETREKEDFIIGIGGKKRALSSKFDAIIEGPHEKHHLYNVPVKVLPEPLENDFPPILGRTGFFEAFEIIFKEKQKKIILKRVQE